MSLLTAPEIKNIIVNEYGFKTIDDYRKMLQDRQQFTAFITQEHIDRLSPDNINCRDFWTVADELFGTDPVCNTSEPRSYNFGASIYDPLSANRTNLHIPKLMGMLNFIDEHAAHTSKVILEIGAGYGCFKNYVEVTTKNQYIGYDIIPRVPGVKATDEQGLFPSDIVKLYGKVHNIYCSNVFQHLSVKQRDHYFIESYKLLDTGGLFMFNTMMDRGEGNRYRFTDGFAYCCHYGQLTPVMKMEASHEQLMKLGYKLLYITQRHDGIVSMVLQKP